MDDKIISFSLFEKDNSIKGFKTNIEKNTLNNKYFRDVLYTGKDIQLVLMTLKGGEDIGEETHENDQFFRFEEGEGKVIINDNEYKVEDGDAIIIPAGSKHNIINTDKGNELKMYTIYAPPHHKDGIIHKTKKDAKDSNEKFDGKISED